MAADPQLGVAAYEAWIAGDTETLKTLVSDDIVWHGFGGGPSPDDYVGKAQVLFYVSSFRRAGLTDGTFSITQENIGGGGDLETAFNVVAHGNYLVGFHTATAQRHGMGLSDREVLVGRVEDGVFTEVWQFFEDPAATQTFWAEQIP